MNTIMIKMEKAQFPLASTVSQLLVNTPTEQIFSRLCQEIKKYHGKSAHSLAELKDRDRQKIERGNGWELFCQQWLISSGSYYKVWLLKETPDEVLKALHLPKRDVGIDLIIQIQDKPISKITEVGFSETSNYIAVQAKFRSKDILTWKSLDSFVGLVALTGPWRFGLITTNCEKIGRREVPVQNRFKSACRATFTNTSRARWCQIAGLGVGKSINFVPEIKEIDDKKIKEIDDKKIKEIDDKKIKEKPIIHEEIKYVALTPEQLRQKRLISMGVKP
jgi:hypothetical protein